MSQDLVKSMRERMEAVSAIVVDVADMRKAYEYAVDLCDKKDPYEALLPEDLPNKPEKTMVAPGLNTKEFNNLEKLCSGKKIELIKAGMRDRLAGVDLAFTVAEFGIAATGTCVIDSTSEELRLATMIAEKHIVVVKKSTIVKRARDIADTLTEWQKEKSRYVAFISGASRTADIERVLTIGVHGPLEFHLLILED